MSTKPLTPKFLNRAMVGFVVDTVLEGCLSSKSLMSEYIVQNPPARPSGACHIVVVGPSVASRKVLEGNSWLTFETEPTVIFEKSVHEDGWRWSHDFKSIARSKAFQLWHDQNVDSNTDVMPHLLFEGDTRYWGGVRRHGIVVTCSGFESYFDQMLSGMIADGIKAFARYEFENSEDVKEGRDFLS